MEGVQVKIQFDPKKKYLRQKDLAVRYNVSEQHIMNLVKAGKFPPPMRLHNMKLWPIELLDRIDNENNNEYMKGLDEKWK